MSLSSLGKKVSLDAGEVDQLFHHLQIHPADRREAQRVLRPFRHTLQAESASVLATSGTTPPTEAPARCYNFYKGQIAHTKQQQQQQRASVEELLALGGDSAHQRAWQPDVLERKHDYIQWLFPLRTRGMNWAAPLLTTRDVVLLRADGAVFTRVLRALQMMFRFYGCSLTFVMVDEKGDASAHKGTGRARICRAANTQEQTAQYRNLLGHFHNCLRITRILQFLAELHLGGLQEGWMEFLFWEVFVDEVVQGDDLHTTTVPPPLQPLRRTYLTFWLETLPSASLRHRILGRAAQVELGGVSQAVPAHERAVWVEAVPLPPGTDLSQLGKDPSVGRDGLVPPSRKRGRSV